MVDDSIGIIVNNDVLLDIGIDPLNMLSGFKCILYKSFWENKKEM